MRLDLFNLNWSPLISGQFLPFFFPFFFFFFLFVCNFRMSDVVNRGLHKLSRAIPLSHVSLYTYYSSNVEVECQIGTRPHFPVNIWRRIPLRHRSYSSARILCYRPKVWGHPIWLDFYILWQPSSVQSTNGAARGGAAFALKATSLIFHRVNLAESSLRFGITLQLLQVNLQHAKGNLSRSISNFLAFLATR